MLSSPNQDSLVKSEVVGPEKPIANGSMDTETTRFVVEFILDLVCPYCYITLKNLDTAVTLYKAKHPEAVFEVVCTPFMLDPLAARSAYDKSNYLQGRNLQRQGHSNEHLASLAKEAGVEFKWTGVTGSTRDAHKLLRFALEPTPTTTRSIAFASGGGPRAPPDPSPSPSLSSATTTTPTTPSSLTRGSALQLRLLAALFTAHHTSDADISSRDFLASLGSSIFTNTNASTNTNNDANDDGKAAAAAAVLRGEVLESAAWDATINALAAEARRGRGVAIGAVPTLVVNDRYVIGGAQDAGFLAAELERIRVAGPGRGRGRRQQGQGQG
ncbi:hypothetical protein Hte_002141 [Hypoxylon texense]